MRLLRPAGDHRNDEDEDAALLRAVAQGDASALGALYDRHAGWLHARLTRRCGDAETVREVLQDTFVTAWQSAGSHRGTRVGGWLWVIAARRLVDAQRAGARAARPGSASGSRDIAWDAVPSAEERVLAGLEYGDVGTALDRISPELREVLRATVIDGLTTRETARLLGIPEGTVKTRAMRARRELRAALDLLATDHDPLGGTA
ncbi:RNA polymerase sigma factor [Streptomyces sp. NPDC055749]